MKGFQHQGGQQGFPQLPSLLTESRYVPAPWDYDQAIVVVQGNNGRHSGALLLEVSERVLCCEGSEHLQSDCGDVTAQA